MDRELVRELYFEAKARRVPMTVLANKLIRDGLELNRLIERTCAARSGLLEPGTLAGRETRPTPGGVRYAR